MNGAEVLGPWAELVVGGLAAAGVRHVVISPGSRSGPFALAALRHPRLVAWSIVDERSAAFFALGQAKATGVATALLATSGTAPAHYLPAVIEASQWGCPLVVITADRPHELVHSGAPQTIEQTRLFDGSALLAIDLGNPDARPEALAGVLARVRQAVALAHGPRPGPVHLNARAAKPLEPREPTSNAGVELAAHARGLLAALDPVAPSPARVAPADTSMRTLAGRLGRAERGLVVCGALGPAQSPPRALLEELLCRTGFGLVAETTSQHRTATGDDPARAPIALEKLLLAPSFRERYAPDLVLQLGASPLAASFGPWLGPGIERHVLSAHGYADPNHAAVTVLECDLTLALETLLRHLEVPGAALRATRGAYRDGLVELAALAAQAVAKHLDGAPELTEGQVVAQTLAETAPGSALVLGSSLVLRAVDLFAPPAMVERPVIAPRGANGIDGLVSTAAGVATVAGPTTLLVGDVSFLHDVGGLWAARHVLSPLTIVVVNDGGGRIFAELPVAEVASPAELEFFTTPHAFDLALAAALYGHAYRRVRTSDELRAALAVSRDGAGVTVIDAVLAPGEPHRELAELRASMQRLLPAERER